MTVLSTFVFGYIIVSPPLPPSSTRTPAHAGPAQRTLALVGLALVGHSPSPPRPPAATVCNDRPATRLRHTRPCGASVASTRPLLPSREAASACAPCPCVAGAVDKQMPLRPQHGRLTSLVHENVVSPPEASRRHSG